MSGIFGDRFGDSNDIGIDMPNWDLAELGTGEITAFSQNSVTITAGDHSYVLHGSHFTFDIIGGTVSLNSGVVTGLDVFPEPASQSGKPEFSITEFRMHVGDFNDFVANDDVTGFQRALFSGHDHLRGAASIDHLTGLGGHDVLAGGDGNDVLDGGKGNDVLQGDGGADLLIGGLGADGFVFNSAADSGGGVYDTIDRFDAGCDQIVVPNCITGVDAKVDAGTSNSVNVDPALAAALDAGHLGVNHAVVATVVVDIGPTGTPIILETFLVVDANGIAGYQAGEDIAIRIADPHGLNQLSVGDFLLTH